MQRTAFSWSVLVRMAFVRGPTRLWPKAKGHRSDRIEFRFGKQSGTTLAA